MIARALWIVAAVLAALMASLDLAQAQVVRGAPLPIIPQPPTTPAAKAQPTQSYDAAELDRIVSPIALYPDPLLAQLLNAATFPHQIPEAARWLEAHREESGQELTDRLADDSVYWDPSVQAMVAFPTVLQMMASAVPWTEELGDAFARQPDAVMDAVQRMRAQAQRYGYLKSNEDLRVSTSPAIEIVPVDPAYVVVPYYDPYVVYAPPRPRYLVASAIYCGYGVRLGRWFEPWGWRQSGFLWPSRRVVYGGYPGWNHRRDYRVVSVRGYRYQPRYEGRPARDPERDWSRGSEWRRDDNDNRDRNGRPSRDSRDVGWSRDRNTPIGGRPTRDGAPRGEPKGEPREEPRGEPPRREPRRGNSQRLRSRTSAPQQASADERTRRTDRRPGPGCPGGGIGRRASLRC